MAFDLATRSLITRFGPEADVVIRDQSVTKYEASAEVAWDAAFYSAVFERLKAYHYDALVLYDMTRLTRSGLMQQLMLEAEIKKHVERVIFATMPIDDRTAQGQAFKEIMATMNALRSKLDKERLVAARRARAEKGFFPGGLLAFGYEVGPDGRVVVNEEQAAVVRQIFDWYGFTGRSLAHPSVRGQGTTWIAYELNRRSVPSPRGGLWEPTGIAGILKNPRYAGHGTYANVTTTYPMIVTPEQFARAQERFSTPNSYANRPRHLMAGFLCHRRVRCGYCNYRTSMRYSHGRVDRARYECVRRHPRPGRSVCEKGPRVPASWLDTAVMDQLQSIANGRGLQYAFTGYLEAWRQEWAEAERMLPSVQQSLREIDDEIERANRSFVQNRWSEERADAFIREARQRAKDQELLAGKYRAALERRAGFMTVMERAGISDLSDTAIVALSGGTGAIASGAEVAAAVHDSVGPSRVLDYETARGLMNEYEIEVTLYEDRIELAGLLPLPTVQFGGETTGTGNTIKEPLSRCNTIPRTLVGQWGSG